MKGIPILYVQPGCHWCREASAFFSKHGIEVDVRDVHHSYADFKHMVEISGQNETPTFEYGDFVVADFSVEEFLSELDERPDIRHKLGIGDFEEEF